MPFLKSKFRAQINEASLVSEETSSAQYLSELCDTNRGFKRKSANLSRKFLSQNKNVRLLCTLTQTQSYNYITFYWQKYYTIIIQQIRAELSFFKKNKTVLHIWKVACKRMRGYCTRRNPMGVICTVSSHHCQSQSVFFNKKTNQHEPTKKQLN